MYQSLKREIQAHPFTYLLLFVTFIIGIFLRTYRTADLLGFYYDQGRDALEVAKILHGNFTLIGPTTGFAGIFRGPFWFYWLLPGYVFGGGSPIIAAIYVATINALGIIVLYIIGAVFFNRITGLLVAFFVTCSYYAVLSARWLSNPSPVWLFGPLAFLCIALAFKKSWKFLPLGLFSLGLTLQLEEAGMGFVVLAVIMYLALHAKQLQIKQWLLGALSFFITFLPLAFFDLRHQFLNTKGVLKLLFGNGDQHSFGMNHDVFAKLRIYSGEFGKELFVNGNLHTFTSLPGIFLLLLLLGIGLGYVLYAHKEKLPSFFLQYKVAKKDKRKKINVLQFFHAHDVLLFACLWLFIPLLSLYFYQQPLYEYYIVGLYPIFFLLVAYALSQYAKIRFGIFVVLFAVFLFLLPNKSFLKGYLSSHVEQMSSTITLENQRQAMAYIYKSAEGKTFAVAVYVPPQLTYSYDYLFRWYRKAYYPQVPETPLAQAQLFYTLHEIDQEHPKLAEEWLMDKDTKGTTLEAKRFGGITVEKREVVANDIVK